MQSLGRGMTGCDFCFRRTILDALLRKDSRESNVEGGRSVTDYCSNVNAGDDSLVQGGDSGGGDKLSDSGYVLQVVSTGFHKRLDVGC